MSENQNNSVRVPLAEMDDDSNNTNNSVTIYEDDQDISYFNKSLNRPQFNPSTSKRSPLALLNRKPSLRSSAAAGSSSQMDNQQVKSAVKNENCCVFVDISEMEPYDPFMQISDEILLEIFYHLPKKTLNRVARVNKRFNRVARDERLWGSIDLGLKYITCHSLGEIITRGTQVLRLAQTKIQLPIFKEGFPYKGFQSKLQYLDLSMTALEPTYLAQLLATCTNLKKLSLEAVKIDNSVCREISKNQSLEVLNLAMVTGFTGIGVRYITKLKSLNSLNISWTDMDKVHVGKLVENLTATMLRLNIAGCRTTLLDSRECITLCWQANMYNVYFV